MWPGADPLKARIGTGLDGDGAPVVVVGVVDDMPQDSLRAPVRPEIFRPLAQPARFPVDGMSLVLRSSGDPAALAAAARAAVRDVHPLAPIAAVRPMTAVAAGGIATERSTAQALAIFGTLALLLSGVGLYGVLARLVGDRTRELGIRLALGAQRGHVGWLVVRRTLALAAAGVGLGALGAFAAARQLGSLLHDTSAADPLVFSGASLVLMLAAVAASYLPARRAARIDPLVAMRD
jgi:predicted lysophospholipase L1 biosynthesis ABC-type transport system permease subunit